MTTMRIRRSKRFAGIGLLSIAVQLLASQALALAGTPASSPTPSASPSPSVSLSFSPSPAPSPSVVEPGPSPDPAPKPDRKREPREVGASGAQAGFAVVADPAAIRVGDASTITAEVTNSGDAEVKDAIARFTLPYQLTLGSSAGGVTDTASGTTSVRFTDIDVAPGETEAVVVSVIGAHGTGTGVAQIVAQLTTGGSVLSSRIAISVSGPGLKLRTFSDQKNVEVGDKLAYNVKVTATGDEALTEVVITDHIPPELKSVWVELLEGITYRRTGSDLIWTVDSLAAGDSLLLRWEGRVAKAGPDYLARNVVEATAMSLPSVTAVSTTALLIPAGNAPVDTGGGGGNGGGNAGTGSGSGSSGSGSSGSSGSGVQGATLPVAAPGTGNPLPFTGSESRPAALSALVLMAAGTLLLWGGRDRVIASGPRDEGSLEPWVALIPQGRVLWDLVQELRREAYGG